MQMGLSILEDGDDLVLVMQFISSDGMKTDIAITGSANYENDIDKIIATFKQAKADIRREKSGLTLVKEIPDALRKPQGRQLNGPRSAGK